MPLVPLIVLGAILFWFVSTATGRAVIKGTIIYFIIMFPTRRWHLPVFLSPPITRHEPTIKLNGRVLKPDIYRVGRANARRLRPGIIIYSPLSPGGNRDPYVVNFLRAMARIGFVVMVPNWIDRPVGLMDVDDIDELEASIGQLMAEPDVDPKRIGVIAVSYGAGPTLIVAAKRKLGKYLQYVMTIGGYVDLLSVLRFASNGRVRVDDQTIWHLQPDPYLRYILLRTLSSWTSHKQDSSTIRAFLAKVRNYDAPISFGPLRDKLSPENQLLLDVMQQGGDDLSLTQLRAVLPASFIKNMDRLSVTPAMLHGVKARVLIVHTTNDRIVPYSEARTLRRHLLKSQQPIMSSLSGFDHTIPPPATPANFFFMYTPNAFKLIPLLYTFFRMQEPEA